MTKKISVESLKTFNSAQCLNDSEDFKKYIEIVEQEGDTDAFSSAFNTVFMALGAHIYAKALDI